MPRCIKKLGVSISVQLAGKLSLRVFITPWSQTLTFPRGCDANQSLSIASVSNSPEISYSISHKLRNGCALPPTRLSQRVPAFLNEPLDQIDLPPSHWILRQQRVRSSVFMISFMQSEWQLRGMHTSIAKQPVVLLAGDSGRKQKPR